MCSSCLLCCFWASLSLLISGSLRPRVKASRRSQLVFKEGGKGWPRAARTRLSCSSSKPPQRPETAAMCLSRLFGCVALCQYFKHQVLRTCINVLWDLVVKEREEFFFLTHKVNITVMDSDIMFPFYGVVFTFSHYWLQQFSGKKTPLSAIYCMKHKRQPAFKVSQKVGRMLCYFKLNNKK